jgi:cytidylate kinase
VKEREEKNFKTWQKIYGKYNFFEPKYYDLVIDTYSSGPLETVGKVLDKIGFDNNNLHRLNTPMSLPRKRESNR